MKLMVYYIFILLMWMGNGFALYKLLTDKQEFLAKFPKLTEAAFNIFYF